MAADRTQKPDADTQKAGANIDRRSVLLGVTALAAGAAALGSGSEATAQTERSVLPIPEPPFRGRIGLTPADSEKDFPPQVAAPEGAPNVVIIMTDDVGYAASEVFGGPIPTPAFKRVAEAGLRYNRFHTTAQCSPTRAALLTGRNHHTAGTGSIMEMGIGYPGYNTVVSKSLAGIGEILKLNGYNTAWFGKNHNVPDWQTSQAGPYDLWPQGLGFEYFYGFIGGDTNQWAPALFEGTTPIEPPHDKKDYHFDVDLADQAIKRLRMLHAMAPNKPFLFYYVPGTSHAPHHAPTEWIDKFKGRFDQGWDKLREEIFARQKTLGIIPADAKLTRRPDIIAAWDSLDAERKRVFARMMEVYAASLAHCDHQINRFLDALEETGRMDNTLIIYVMGDNGPSGEGGDQGMLNEMTLFNGVIENFDDVKKGYDTLGGPMHFNHKPVGWAHAMATPYQWTKVIASHFGGIRNGMAIAWPKRIKDKGGLRSQFHHVIDILPTVLEAAGLPAPVEVNGIDQKPIEGVSMAYSFDDANAAGRRITQYFEIYARRGIYHDGWFAATKLKAAPWSRDSTIPSKNAHTEYEWELYNIEQDFTQADDVAATYPEKLQEMKDLFLVEATKYNVLPLSDSALDRWDVSNRPSLTEGRNTFTYYAGLTRIPEGSQPDLKNRSWNIEARVKIPDGGAEGILLTTGGRFNGIGLYLHEGRPVFVYNYLGLERTFVKAPERLSPGAHTILARFNYSGDGAGKPADIELLVDGKNVGKARVPNTIPLRLSLDETMDIGEDTGTPVSEDYQVPFRFTGTIEKVVVNLT